MDSYLYQYLVGGAVFAAGIGLIWRTGAIGWRPGRPRRRLLVLIGGLALFAGVQGALLWLAGVP